MALIRYVMVLVFCGSIIAGCGNDAYDQQQQADGDANTDGADISVTAPDPQEAVKIIERFFRDNPSGKVMVDIQTFAPDLEWVVVSENENVLLTKALRDDSRPLKPKKPLWPTLITNSAWIIFNGNDYTIIVVLDEFGFGIGGHSIGRHHFVNPSLANILRDIFRNEGVLKGPFGAEMSHRLRKGAGEIPPDAPE